MLVHEQASSYSRLANSNLDFNFHNPTRLFFGNGTLAEFEKQATLGHKALLFIFGGKPATAKGSLACVATQLAGLAASHFAIRTQQLFSQEHNKKRPYTASFHSGSNDEIDDIIVIPLARKLALPVSSRALLTECLSFVCLTRNKHNQNHHTGKCLRNGDANGLHFICTCCGYHMQQVYCCVVYKMRRHTRPQ